MGIYLIMTACGLILCAIGLVAAAWLIGTGQLDDLDTPSLRMLADDPPAPPLPPSVPAPTTTSTNPRTSP